MSDPNLDLLPRLARRNDRRILFLVLDGLGGVLGRGRTALQISRHPHLDALARESALGRHVPVALGVTPGSGPGHFSLFGYDPLRTDVGRGVLEALGVGLALGLEDVAARCNLCTLTSDGKVADRRAGRIATEAAAGLVDALARAVPVLEDARVELRQGLQHRFALVLRGEGLSPAVADTDPQVAGVAPLPALPLEPGAEKTARLADAFAARAREVLAGQDAANAVLLRGFSRRPALPTLGDLAKLRPCAIAPYPAYRGVARLLGMEVREDVDASSTIEDEVASLERAFREPYDFYFLHVKGTDSAGEDGDEERKARVIEEFDAVVPRIRALEPDVIVLTGDHATPGPYRAHSWHPVPFLLHGPWCEPDGIAPFDEEACHRGRFGSSMPATALIRLALANAEKLVKHGA